MSFWELIGVPTKSESDFLKRRNKHRLPPELVYKYKRVCIMRAYRENENTPQPDYCKEIFWTNKKSKLCCCSFCSIDYIESRNKRRLAHG